MYMYKGQIGGLEIGIAELRCNVRGKGSRREDPVLIIRGIFKWAG